VDDTPIISDESHIKKLSVNNTSFVGTKRPEPVVVDDANNTCQSHNYQYEDTYKFHLVTAHKLKRGPIGKSLPKLKPQPNIIPVADDPNNTCRSCNHTFASKQSYRKHLMAIHKMKLEPLNGLPRLKPQPNVAPVVDDSNNYCRSCKYQFSSKRAYRWHLTKLHKMKFKPVRKGKPRPKPQADLSPVPDDPNNTCRSCKYRFVSKICYRRHLINVHKIKLEPLERSSPKLKPRPNITPAVDDPNNTCRSCQHQFYSKPGYKRHLINVHKMKLEPLKVIKWKAQSSTPPSKHNR
jgi:hypothetical protein